MWWRDEDAISLAVGTDCEDWRAATGELRLIAGVLEQAISDARRGDPEAIAWLASDEESPEAWTLVAICRHLDVEPGWIRDLVAAHLEAHPYVGPSRPFGARSTAEAA